MYKRVFVGIDGSPHSEHALQHALGLAKALGATVRIVHVVDLGWMPVTPELGIAATNLEAAGREERERLLAAAMDAAKAKGVTADSRLIETTSPSQQTAAALVDEAMRWPADVIVIGARGRTGVERLLLGSVADGVARRSTLPVLLVQ